jgi:hypothetical protein
MGWSSKELIMWLLSTSILRLRITTRPKTEPPCFGLLFLCMNKSVAISSSSSMSNS